MDYSIALLARIFSTLLYYYYYYYHYLSLCIFIFIIFFGIRMWNVVFEHPYPDDLMKVVIVEFKFHLCFNEKYFLLSVPNPFRRVITNNSSFLLVLLPPPFTFHSRFILGYWYFRYYMYLSIIPADLLKIIKNCHINLFQMKTLPSWSK